MKIWISCDMEGIAGIVDWSQCRPEHPQAYELGCRLMLGEVNAAIRGAMAGGATEFVVNDSHGRMANLDPSKLLGDASYLAGSHKPLYMMQGLDASCDAAFWIGYHGMISGAPSAMSHSYNPNVFSGARINGIETGEGGINALVQQHYSVPVALVSGDQWTWEQNKEFTPDAEHVQTKESITRFSALNLHPAVSCARIAKAAKLATERLSSGSLRPPQLEIPVNLELDTQTSDMAQVASWVGGVDLVAERTVSIKGDDLLDVFKKFVAVNYITRQAGGR